MHPASFIFVILKPFYHTFAYSKQKKNEGRTVDIVTKFLK